MNSTLKQLAHQSGITVNAELEQFAQLLINECYNRAEKQYHHSSDEWDKAVMAVMDSIDELFGVEE